jgi:hypothetical protein
MIYVLYYMLRAVTNLAFPPPIDFGDGHHEIFSYCGGGLTSSPEVAVIVTAQESLAPIS